MTNKYYQPGEQRGARVGDLFGAIAPRYDLINDLQSLWLHRRWKRLLVQMASVRKGEKALDLCCGTGDIAFALHEAGADVIGLDFSPAMLSIATQRSRGAPVQFIRGDAMHVPFPDESFEIVTIGYGLRNLENWEAGLEEMARLTHPGGRLLVLDFGKPKNPLWRGIYFAWLRWVVPIFGKMFCHDAATYAYICESLKAYPAQRGVSEKMRAMGCQDIQVRNLLAGAMSIHSARKALPPPS